MSLCSAVLVHSFIHSGVQRFTNVFGASSLKLRVLFMLYIGSDSPPLCCLTPLATLKAVNPAATAGLKNLAFC